MRRNGGRRRWLLGAAILAGLAVPGGAIAAAIYYGYDPDGRLVTAHYDNNSCVVYSYDENGNRTSQTNTIGSTEESPTWGSGVFGCFSWTAP